MTSDLPLEARDLDGPALTKRSTPASRRVRVVGVPSSAGGLFNGTEDAPRAYRSAGLVPLLASRGVDVTDGGDVPIPSFLPRHNVPPVRNWPAPRIVWELVAPTVAAAYAAGDFPLIIGGDCSVVVGAVAGLVDAGADSLHVIYVDGHVDAVAPRANVSAGAASMGLWFLTTPTPLWTGPRLDPEAIAVVGCTELQGLELPIQVIDAAAVAEDPTGSVAAALAGVPDDADILVHFDVDVLNAREMPAAYSPNPHGLPCDTVRELLRALLQDRRVVAVEVPEYTTQRRRGRLAVEIASEEQAGITLRSHCGRREKWWVLDDWRPPHAFLPYMGARPRGLVLNYSRTTCTNAIHRVYFESEVDREVVCASTWSSLFDVVAELRGRHYGGGVLKLEPTVAQGLPVIGNVDNSPLELDVVREHFLAGRRDEARRELDTIFLGGVLGVSQDEICALRDAASTLRARRVRPRNGDASPSRPVA
jgi:arginase